MKEIKEEFKCDPKKYFQILREPEKKPKFRYSSKPKSGGRIVAVHRPNGSNPMRAENDILDEDSWTARAAETITMFCCLNGIHYALTCFHFCWNQAFEEALKRDQLEEILQIRNSIEFYKERTKQQVQFFYQIENKNAVNSPDYVHLGTFSDCHFDEKCDIISVKVSENVAIDCQIQRIDTPDWNIIWPELKDRIFKNDVVEVQKHGFQEQEQEQKQEKEQKQEQEQEQQQEKGQDSAHEGKIIKINHTHVCQGEWLFQNAIVIKGKSGSFLKDGDSGSLVSFVDKKKRRQAFAYGIAEVDKLTEIEASSDEDDEASTESSESSDCDENNCVSVSESCVGEYGAAADESLMDVLAGESCDVEFSDENGPFSILFRLNIALNNLELSNAGCFGVCGGRQ